MKKMIRGILMVILLLVIILLFIVLAGKLSSQKNSQPVMSEEAINAVLVQQEVVFLMSYKSYSERHIAGYVIDRNGKKYRYSLLDQWPFKSLEEEYSYVMEHLDEFKPVDFWDRETLKACTGALYAVDADAKLKKSGGLLFDAPLAELYGVRRKDGKEEFVKLITDDSGEIEQLKDPSADFIMENMGESWNLP